MGSINLIPLGNVLNTRFLLYPMGSRLPRHFGDSERAPSLQQPPLSARLLWKQRTEPQRITILHVECPLQASTFIWSRVSLEATSSSGSWTNSPSAGLWTGYGGQRWVNPHPARAEFQRNGCCFNPTVDPRHVVVQTITALGSDVVEKVGRSFLSFGGSGCLNQGSPAWLTCRSSWARRGLKRSLWGG